MPWIGSRTMYIPLLTTQASASMQTLPHCTGLNNTNPTVLLIIATNCLVLFKLELLSISISFLSYYSKPVTYYQNAQEAF